MADLSKKYQDILKELEGQITDKNELEFVKQKFSELAIIYMDAINNVLDIQKNQSMLENKVRRIQRKIDNIEEDIYITDEEYGYDQMHDNDYEFEITCPYCDYEFVTDSSYKNEKEMECPKCHSMIELDWSIDECNGECNECKEHCYNENEEDNANQDLAVAEESQEYILDDDDEVENQQTKENNDNNKKDNEDDM